LEYGSRRVPTHDLEATIREATAADADAVVSLVEEVGSERRWIASEPPYDTAQRRREWLEDLGTATTAFVAECEGELVGELSLWKGEPGTLGLGMVVREGYRRRGIGSALMRAALEAARSLDGIGAIELAVFPDNAAALALYRRHGFVEVAFKERVVPRRDGEAWDAILMRLELAG